MAPSSLLRAATSSRRRSARGAEEETLRGTRQELEAARGDILSREAQLAELQEKFLQSSAHIMEETIK